MANFLKVGIGGFVNMDQVDRAQINPGAIYLHFGSVKFTIDKMVMPEAYRRVKEYFQPIESEPAPIVKKPRVKK
jgi:hypothetical protein